MSRSKEYQKAVQQAKANYTGLLERGADAIGGDVLTHLESLLTPEEIAASISEFPS